MPFRNCQQFDTETLDLMREAYDSAMQRTGSKSEDPISGKLAAEIAKLAESGERDPAVLSELALRQLHLWPTPAGNRKSVQ